MKPWHVEICDVTLRDGEQTPGVSFSCEEKVAIAGILDAVGVEVIEAGFPVVSANEKECVAAIARMGLEARICCLARAKREDVDCAIDCDVDLVSIFIATSDLHIRHKYKKPREAVLAAALDMVEYAVDHGLAVRFAAEDASRTNIGFLQEMYRQGEEHGAAYCSFADTVGCLTPLEMAEAVRTLAGGLSIPLCVHCHNDMGCATANTITGAASGAFQLHTTVNGIGERAGNASLEEVLVALRLRGGVDRYDLSLLHRLSETVAQAAKIPVPKLKPIVGEHAFAHESGIHIAAILEDPLTYEYIPPELVGGHRCFILGKHTGRKALEHIVASQGCNLAPHQMAWALAEVKRRSEGKCCITPEVLLAIIAQAEGVGAVADPR
ncbi:MAG: homoaconitate hydratase [Methanomicrobiales archaeon]|nr:homoaconitate hydratase [Methanomicrobiales archaeon]